MLTQLHAIAVCGFYAALVVVYGRQFREGRVDRPWVMRGLLAATVLVHLLLFLVFALRYQRSLMTTVGGAMSAMALGLTIAYLLIEWMTGERNLGVWIVGLALTFQAIATAMAPGRAPAGSLPTSPLLDVHIGVAMTGYCALSLSAAFSLMYLLLYHQIKIRRLGLLFDRLPSLDMLEKMGYRAIQFGLGFLLAGMLLGEHLFHKVNGRMALKDTKTLIAFFACAVYGVTVLLRSPLAIRGKRFAVFSIAGFGLILFSLFVVNQFLTGFHKF
jgi:ABC-type uncharacterized transport system permease subunit